MPTRISWDKDAGVKCAFHEFTQWVPWSRNKELVDPYWNDRVGNYPGVYLLAHFTTPPAGTADFLDPNVIYVGEGGLLARRWAQFERSAYYHLPGHSGGHTYRKTYKRQRWQELHVAALPIWFGANESTPLENWTLAFRLYVERRIIWEITVHRGGTHGLVNRK